jgi:hypothetical protein
VTAQAELNFAVRFGAIPAGSATPDGFLTTKHTTSAKVTILGLTIASHVAIYHKDLGLHRAGSHLCVFVREALCSCLCG